MSQVVARKQVIRKAGDSAKKLMYEVVELRKRSPELFVDLVVFQQPAAFMDEIIQTWVIQDSADRIPQGIHQRDLFAAALTKTCRDAMKLAQQIPAWVAPKMTPVLQLTDTDIAFILKQCAEIRKREIARELRAAAKAEGEMAVLDDLSLENILKIAGRAHKGVQEKVADTKLVLAGLRRNRMLSWRPDLKTGKLIRSDEQSWAKELPEGSHRQREEWSVDRYKWLDADGKPEYPDWTVVDNAKDVADLAETDYCSKEQQHQQDYTVQIGGKKITIPVCEIVADHQSLVPENELDDFLDPKARRLKMEAAKQQISKDGKDRKAIAIVTSC